MKKNAKQTTTAAATVAPATEQPQPTQQPERKPDFYQRLVTERPTEAASILATLCRRKDKALRAMNDAHSNGKDFGDAYSKDLTEQGVVFPSVQQPRAVLFEMPPALEALYDRTVELLSRTDSGGLTYNRYRAIAYLKEDRKRQYQNADRIAQQLATIMRTLLIKRIDSSFHAFRLSLNRFRQATDIMLGMFDAGTIYIAPNLRVTEFLVEDREDELNRIGTTAPRRIERNPARLCCRGKTSAPSPTKAVTPAKASRTSSMSRRTAGSGWSTPSCAHEAAAQNYHLIMQVAHILEQLLVNGRLRRLTQACRKVTDVKLIELLRASLLHVRIDDTLPTFGQIRFSSA